MNHHGNNGRRSSTLTVSLAHILPSNLYTWLFQQLSGFTNLSESPSIHLLLSSFSSPSPHKLNLLPLFYKLPAISSHPILLHHCMEKKDSRGSSWTKEVCGLMGKTLGHLVEVLYSWLRSGLMATKSEYFLQFLQFLSS